MSEKKYKLLNNYVANHYIVGIEPWTTNAEIVAMLNEREELLSEVEAWRSMFPGQQVERHKGSTALVGIPPMTVEYREEKGGDDE